MARRSRVERKSAPLSPPAYEVRNWMEEHHQGMLCCPYQPGQLILSKEACARRHMTARQETYDDMMDLDVFRLQVKKGLILCRQCLVGQRLAATLTLRPLRIEDPEVAEAAGS